MKLYVMRSVYNIQLILWLKYFPNKQYYKSRLIGAFHKLSIQNKCLFNPLLFIFTSIIIRSLDYVLNYYV